MNCFDPLRWEMAIQKERWYLELHEEIQKIFGLKDSNLELYEACKEQIYDFFQAMLGSDKIPFGKPILNWDIQRQQIDTAVIHHTSEKSGLSKERLSAIELARLYVPYFANPKRPSDRNIKGKAIFSGHTRNRKEIFWPYHWIIRDNGEAERLLRDHEIGWHSGNWDINTRSVGIVMDQDLSNIVPSEDLMRGVAEIIRKYKLEKHRIFGHQEITDTACPSKLFPSWKLTLLNFI